MLHDEDWRGGLALDRMVHEMRCRLMLVKDGGPAIEFTRTGCRDSKCRLITHDASYDVTMC